MKRCGLLAKIVVLAGALWALASPLSGSQAAIPQAAIPSTSASTPAVLPNFATQGNNLIRLLSGAFDPLSDLKPTGALPSLTSDSTLPSGTAQYWLLQVENARFAQAQEAVERAGGKVAGVVPDATYLVRATRAQKATIANSPAVRWMGYYQPSWRFAVAAAGRPGLLDLEGTQTYRVYVFDIEPDPAVVARALRAIPGVKVASNQGVVIDVKATAAQVPAIAAIPAVEWVSVKPKTIAMNSNARWVNDTGVRDVYAATAPGRLTGAGQTTAVADTAVNYIYDLNGRAHIAFRDCNPDGTGCKLAEYIQTTAGSSTAAITGITDTGTTHRKVVAFFDLGVSGPNPYDESTHGTHTSGSVTGDAPPYGTWNGDDGLAPGARLVSQNIADTGGGLSGLPGGLETPAEIAQLYRQAYRPRGPAGVTLSSPATGNIDYYCVEGTATGCAYRNLEDARTHNNSWGSIVPLVDTGQTVAINKFVFDHEDFTIVFSAGNEGPEPGTVHEPGDGKNYFSSGASANGRQPMVSIDSMGSFSSHGPTSDGRFGPTVATPGQIVVSSKGGTVNGYHTAQGTSMSAPVLTGLLTLVRQYFFDGYGPGNFGLVAKAPGGGGFAGGTADVSRRHNPSAALVRAAVVNGAVRMRGWYTGDDGNNRALDGQWPSSGQGWGAVNLDNALYFANDPANNWYMDVYRGDTTATGTACTAAGGLAAADCTSFPVANSSAMRQFHIHVEPGKPLDISLAWTDTQGSLPAGADPLINNLNLLVLGPGGAQYVGNNMNTRTNAALTNAQAETPDQPFAPDVKNTAERIRVANPPAGDYTIQVIAPAIVTGNQGFALAASGNISPFGGPAFTPGPALQVDQTGSPTISNVKVTPVGNDTVRVTFDTDEPTTAQLTTTPATATFKDSYNVGNDDPVNGPGPGLFGLAEGPVETSGEYANKLAVGTKHEILLTGLTRGTSYTLNLSATDLGANTVPDTANLTTPGLAFQADAPDIGQLYEDPASATASLWRTGTQMYASDDGATGGALGAFAFRIPTAAIDPANITGAYVELTSSHFWHNTYTSDPITYVDLLPESVEPNWGQPSTTYNTIHDAPLQTRLNPETTHHVGAYQKYAFAFACSDLQTLKDSLTTPTGGNRMAAFRWDASVEPVAGLFAQEFGFNRRSRGPDNRAKLVLYTSANQNPTGQACNANTAAPTISDVGIHRGILDAGMVTVSWNTDVRSDSMVLFREQGASSWIQVGSPALTTLHQVEVRGLDSTKEYEFVVRSAACNGATTTDTNGGQGYDFFYPPVQTATYYFHGMANDQALKTLNFPPYPAGNLTFNQTAPTETVPDVQTASFLGDPGGTPADTFSALFIGPFPTGVINKDITLEWYWSAPNANPALGQDLVIDVWDVNEAGAATSGTVIGEATVNLSLGQTPTLNKHIIHVNGTIQPGHKLMIQAAPFFVVTGEQDEVTYDATMFPSRFSYLVGSPPPGLPSTGPVPPPSANATNLQVPATRLGAASPEDIAAGTAACSIAGPTVTTIASFAGKATSRRAVKLTWRTSSEVDTLAFNVWRFSQRGKAVKVNRTLVAARAAGRTGGAVYRVLDRRVRPGRYTYRLQVVGRDGARSWRASTAVRVF
jgi:hypothetical protein